jgi:hypothetical protein
LKDKRRRQYKMKQRDWLDRETFGLSNQVRTQIEEKVLKLLRNFDTSSNLLVSGFLVGALTRHA